MDIDKVTLNDLAIFSNEDGHSVLNKLDHTRTVQGREQLKKILHTPQTSIDKISDIQHTIRLAGAIELPEQVSNGTLMVIEQFYETALSPIPRKAGSLDVISYKIFRSPDFSLIRYSTGHCTDLIIGMHALVEKFRKNDQPDTRGKSG